MVNNEILGGLRHALNRGESLEKAMISFYNAGYKKEEIEEAARFIQQEGVSTSPSVKEANLIQKQINFQPKVSSYGQEEFNKPNPVKKAAKGLVIAIIITAIIFVGLLIAFLVTT